jgi:hypothetical protein
MLDVTTVGCSSGASATVFIHSVCHSKGLSAARRVPQSETVQFCVVIKILQRGSACRRPKKEGTNSNVTFVRRLKKNRFKKNQVINIGL